jgi:hypothetical protein
MCATAEGDTASRTGLPASPQESDDAATSPEPLGAGDKQTVFGCTPLLQPSRLARMSQVHVITLQREHGGG